MDMQSIIADLTAKREELNGLHNRRPDAVLAMRIDLLGAAIAALHHYEAPDAKIREALSL